MVIKTQDYVKICPKCGSLDNSIPPAGSDLQLTYTDYCKKCKYRGNFPEVEKSKIKDFKKEVQNQKSKQ